MDAGKVSSLFDAEPARAKVSSIVAKPARLPSSAAPSGAKGQHKIVWKHCAAAIAEAQTGETLVPNEETGEVDRVRLSSGGLEMGVLFLCPEEQDMLEVHVLLMGMSGPGEAFEGGEFIIKMNMKPERGAGTGYPFEPPDFTFLTPNGVFTINAGTPCISIGKYHATQLGSSGKSGAYGYSAGLKLSGFANAIWGIFFDPKSLGGGINVLAANGEPEWRAAARASRAHNDKHHRALMARFAEVYPNLEARRAFHAAQCRKK